MRGPPIEQSKRAEQVEVEETDLSHLKARRISGIFARLQVLLEWPKTPEV